MNDPTDPYTRQPMKLEDAKIDEQLKSEIDAYILAKKLEYETGREERERQRALNQKEAELDHLDLDSELYD